MIVKMCNFIITLNDPGWDFWKKKNLLLQWQSFWRASPVFFGCRDLSWSSARCLVDGGFLYVLCLRSQGCNPLIFSESELMTKCFKRLHGASVTRLKLHKWRLSCTLKCVCYSLEEPVLPVQSNHSVSCERCCFQLQVLMNVDLTGNADPRVFFEMLKRASFFFTSPKEKKIMDFQTIRCFWLILFSEMSAYIYKGDADVKTNPKQL